MTRVLASTTDGASAAAGPAESARSRARSLGGRAVRTARPVLFAATGLAVPFHAFPPVVVGGRAIDLATILAALFVLSTPPRTLARRIASWPWLLAFAFVPLLALLLPEAPPFSHRQFALSWGHWLLVTGFFVSALDLDLDPRRVSRLLLAQVVLASTVAVFALYQVAAWSAGGGWPLSGPLLCPLQKEPLRLSAYVAGFVRPTSVFLEPAWLAGYLAWTFACAGALAAAAAGARRAALGAAAATIAVALVATVSPGGYLDLAAGALALVLAAAAPGVRSLRAPGLAFALGTSLAVVGVVLLAPAGRPIVSAIAARARQLVRTSITAPERGSPGQDPSAALRLVSARDSVRLLARRPWNGIGLGQFPAFQQAVNGRLPSESQPWLGWLGIAAEAGALGPVLLALPLALAVARLRGASRGARLLVPALVALLAVQPLHGAYYIDLAWWFPAALAFVAAAARGAGSGPATLGP